MKKFKFRALGRGIVTAFVVAILSLGLFVAPKAFAADTVLPRPAAPKIVDDPAVCGDAHYVLPDDVPGKYVWELETNGDAIVSTLPGYIFEGNDRSISYPAPADKCPPPPADDDNDGVPNTQDKCPATPAGEAVDANGCSASQRDTDDDGVTDDKDKCPNTPAGTKVGKDGCPVVVPPADDDNDGVPNTQDKCPATPAGEAVDANGCSASQRDTDDDGVTDDKDKCPNTPAGTKVGKDGCPVVVPNPDPKPSEDPKPTEKPVPPKADEPKPVVKTVAGTSGNGRGVSAKTGVEDGVDPLAIVMLGLIASAVSGGMLVGSRRKG